MKHNKFTRALARKKKTAAFLTLLILGAGYFAVRAANRTPDETRYLTAEAARGALSLSVSGTGQVSITNQTDIKSKVGADTITVRVKNGDEVTAGALLVELDARDAEKAVRDAETNLESARLALEKLKKPADTLSLLQAENSLAQAREAKTKAEDDLMKTYEDGFTAVTNAFIDLPAIISGLYDTLFGTAMSGTSQANVDYYANTVEQYASAVIALEAEARASYLKARIAYDTTFARYKTADRLASRGTIRALIDETYETTRSIADAMKDTADLVQFYKDTLVARNQKAHPATESVIAGLNTLTGKTNTNLSGLLAIRRTIQTGEDAIINAERSIAERTEALAKLKNGADALDIQSQKLSITQRENALRDAKDKLADYFIHAPYAGIVAKMNAKKGESVASGAAVATLITKQRIAEITLNEVDIARVKVGLPAALTFDAVPDLTISGRVTEVDTIGTASQGVVSYIVKIGLDAQDDRVRPGMTASANITIEMKPDALLVPNAAVKPQGARSYVEVANRNQVVQARANGIRGVTLASPPSRVPVQVGISNDEFTEIISGIEAGAIVITGTLAPQPNGAGAAGGPQTGRQSGNTFRFPGAPPAGGNSGPRVMVR